jgi:hypothetical protein
MHWRGRASLGIVRTMTMTAARSSALPGAAVIARVRRMVIGGAVLAFAYSSFAVASRGRCVGGVSGSGGFVDGDGMPTDTAPTCLTLTLGPSPVVLVAMLALFVWSLGAVLHADSPDAAIRTLDRTAAVIVAVVVGSAVIAAVWFFALPLSSWQGGDVAFVLPFPFGSVETEITPAVVD